MAAMTTDQAGPTGSSHAARSRPEGGDSRPVVLAAVAATTLALLAYALIHPRNLLLDDVVRTGPVLLGLLALFLFAPRIVLRGPRARYFAVGHAAFIVPAHRGFGYLVASEVFGFGIIASLAISMWSSFAGSDEPTAAILTRLWLLVGMLILTLAYAAVVIVMITSTLRRRPRVELTQDALLIRGIFGTRTIPWVPAAFHVRPNSKLNLVWADVDPAFIADAITFYVDHPAERDAIGTHEGHERLLAHLGADRQAAPPAS